MLNQIVLVGRLVKNMENGDEYITLACPRSYKNAEGVYETDFIDCKVYNNIASNAAEYCKKGDIIGVKGRLQSTTHDDGDGHYTKKMEVVAEKITFLSSKHSEDINA
jgi:single-strand DNA-binding protein